MEMEPEYVSSSHSDLVCVKKIIPCYGPPTIDKIYCLLKDNQFKILTFSYELTKLLVNKLEGNYQIGLIPFSFSSFLPPEEEKEGIFAIINNKNRKVLKIVMGKDIADLFLNNKTLLVGIKLHPGDILIIK